MAGVGATLFAARSQVHKDLERSLSQFLQTDDTLLYSSCFDANAGCLKRSGEEDAIISDELNHASIIDASAFAKPSAIASHTT